MRTFIQWFLACRGWWKPEIGALYRSDEKFVPNPFDPSKKPNIVKVLDVKDGFVQYELLEHPGMPQSGTIRGFAAWRIKVKP